MNQRVRTWLPWLLLAIAVVATAIVYWPGTTGGWVFDDYPNIVQNNAIHITPGHSTLAVWVNSALSSPSSFLRRPLASLTFSANWYFGGGNPWDFKVTNIVIHLVNGVLLFVMLRALLRLLMLRADIPPMLRIDPLRSEGGERDRSLSAEGGEHDPSFRTEGGDHDLPPSAEGSERRDAAMHASPPPSAGRAERSERARSARGDGFFRIDDSAATRLALIAAAAWMLLPINLMAVLYVVQRMESLCQVFVLAGLWAYLHGRWMMLTAADDAKRDRRGFAVAVAGIVLGTLIGLTSKETAVLLPGFAFLAEWVVVGFGSGGTVPMASAEPSPAPTGHHGALGHGWQSYPEGEGKARSDKRIWTLFTITLFVPAVLGFLWLLRGVLRPGALAGRDFTLGQRLLTEARVLVDYLHWTLFPNPAVLSLYHD
ncbi:MAG: hypothetical protein ACREPH_00875 [Rhodanobacteraceae bacterium]